MSEPANVALILNAAPPNADGDVQLTLTVKNNGEAVWLNRRMVVNAPHALPEIREVWLDVIGPNGEPVTFLAKIRAGHSEAQHYGVLEAGAEHAIEIPLARYYATSAPGAYRIVAHYHDGNPKPPKPPKGVQHFSGELVSAPLTLEIPRTAGP